MWNSVPTPLYPTVLIAEDSRDTRIMLKRAFELKGYSVIEAEHGGKRSKSFIERVLISSLWI